MILRKLTYLFLISFILQACSTTKNVPEGKYLLKKNKIEIKGAKLSNSEFHEVLKQRSNLKVLGIKMKLIAYNWIDSTKVANKRTRKNQKIRKINTKRIQRQNRINEERIKKAREKNKDFYNEKTIALKDTVNPSKFFREWLKYKYGEAPIIFDSLLYVKSQQQLALYLKVKGYYYGSVRSELIKHRKRKKIIPKFYIETGPAYYIDSTYIKINNPTVKQEYFNYIKKNPDDELKGKIFDSEMLDDLRNKLAKNMRDNALYGFSPNHIEYEVDTNKRDMKVTIGIVMKDRTIIVPGTKDSLVSVPHQITYIKDVYFHISDTTMFEGKFSETINSLGLQIQQGQYLPTLDTCVFQYYKDKQGQVLTRREATFYYNQKLVVKAKVIEEQNFLEKSNYYKEYYIDRTYSRLIQLGVFKTIKPVLIEIPGTNQLEVHYYLEPASRRTFYVEPQATNSNGYLGVNASIKYIDKNLFRGAQKFTFALTGGFESSPAVFGVQDDQKVKKETRSFNTFEIGPYMRYELPKLTPFGFLTLSKRHRPRTIMNASMNYQKRSDFQRSILQLSYYWRFSSVDRLQTFTLGLPLISSISFVTIKKSDEFEKRINDLNDLFLKNSYSNQFIWEDLKFGWQYNNTEKKNKRSKDIFFYNVNAVFAGNFLSLFSAKQDTVAGGAKAFLKNAYSQFFKLDNELIYSYPFKKGNSIHFKFQAGFGLPYGNTNVSLPYDYAFYAGGANDNRGWRSRTMAPGAYQKDLDSSRTITQIGDIRLGGSVEYRIRISKLIRTAIFADAGNIWLMNKDVNRPGSQFSKNWFKEIGLAMGVGLRLDFDFFVLRLDAGIPIYNPYVTEGSRWIFNSHTDYNNKLKATWGENWKVYRGFMPVLHLGIGYPF